MPALAMTAAPMRVCEDGNACQKTKIETDRPDHDQVVEGRQHRGRGVLQGG